MGSYAGSYPTGMCLVLYRWMDLKAFWCLCFHPFHTSLQNCSLIGSAALTESPTSHISRWWCTDFTRETERSIVVQWTHEESRAILVLFIHSL